MDKLDKLYQLYKNSGIITDATPIEKFRSATEDQKSELYRLGKSKDLFKTTDINTFMSAWGEPATVKKKEESALPSKKESILSGTPGTEAQEPSASSQFQSKEYRPFAGFKPVESKAMTKEVQAAKAEEAIKEAKKGITKNVYVDPSQLNTYQRRGVAKARDFEAVSARASALQQQYGDFGFLFKPNESKFFGNDITVVSDDGSSIGFNVFENSSDNAKNAKALQDFLFSKSGGKKKREMTPQEMLVYSKGDGYQNISKEKYDRIYSDENIIKSLNFMNEKISAEVMGLKESEKEISDIEKTIESGAATEEDLNKYNQKIELYNLKVKDIKASARLKEQSLKNVIANRLEREKDKGNWASATYNGLVNGVEDLAKGVIYAAFEGTDILTMGLMDDYKKYSQEDYANKAIEKGAEILRARGVSEEYTKSGSWAKQTLFSVTESIPTLLTPGGPLARLSAMTTQGVGRRMDEYDKDPKMQKMMSKEEAFLVNLLKSIVEAKLENVGITQAFSGKGLANSLAIKALQKWSPSMGNKALNALLNTEVNNLAAKVALNTAGAFIVETETGALQNVMETSINELYNVAKDKQVFNQPKVFTKDWMDALVKDAVMEGLGGMWMGGAVNIAKYTAEGVLGAKLNNEEFAIVKKMMSDGYTSEALSLMLKSKVANKEITTEEANQIRRNFNKAKSIVDQMPEGELSEGQQRASFDLINERMKLEQEISGKDPNLTSKKRKRINEINERLKLISENAIQEQTAVQVPIQPEARAGEEVAEGAPEAGPEVAAEEGKTQAKEVKVFELDGKKYEVTEGSTTDLETGNLVPIELADKISEQGTLVETRPTQEEEVSLKTQEEVAKQYAEDLKETKDSDPEQYWSVDTVSEEAAKEGTVIMDEDGGVVVSKDGDIKGLFKRASSKAKGVAQKLLQKAIEAGGTKLDNFDTYLTPIYKKAGFRVVSRIPFNEEYAPEGWNKEKHGTPDVVAMVYDPNNELDIEERTFEDYDEAMAYRNSYIEQSRAEVSQQQTLAAEQGTSTTIEGTGLRENIKKAVAKVFKNLQTRSFNNGEEMAKYARDKYGVEIGQEEAARVFQSADGGVEIVVNEEIADDTSFGHEVWHAVLLKAFGDNQKQFAAFRGAIDKALRDNGFDEIADSLDEFSSQYTEEREVPAEEYLAQLGGMLTSSKIDAKSLSTEQKTLLQQIKDIINDFAVKLTGQPVFLQDATPETILDFMSTISEMMAKGEDISGFFEGSEKDAQTKTRAQKAAIEILDGPKFDNKLKEDVASYLNSLRDSEIPPNSSREQLMERFINNVYEEVGYYLFSKPDARSAGLTWYIEDMVEFENKVKVILPELSNENQYKLFLSILAFTSSGTNPNQNLSYAYNLWNNSNDPKNFEFSKDWGDKKLSFVDKKGKAVASGVIVKETAREYTVELVDSLGRPEVDGKGNKKYEKVSKASMKPGYPKPTGYTNRGKVIVGQLEKLEKLYADLKSIDAVVQWLETPHPIAELRKYNEAVPDVNGKGPGKTNKKYDPSKNADGERNGAFIFGEKIGSFYQNMIGIGETITMDLWWSRTWNRYMGTMINTVSGKKEIQEVPRSDRERNIMREAVKMVAEDLNLQVSELQAAIWYFEQELWTKAGNASPSYSYVTAIDELTEKLKVDEETRTKLRAAEADLSEAEKRRQNAAERAADVVASKGGKIPSVEVTTRAQKAKPQNIPGYDRMMKQLEGVVEKSKNRGGTKEQQLENAMSYLQKSKVYESADDSQREKMVRDVRKMMGKREKSSPSVDKMFGTVKDVKKITITEKAALAESMRKEARGASNAIAARNAITKRLDAYIKTLVTKGTVTTKQMSAVMTRYAKVNPFSSVSVGNFIDYMSKVFKDAEYTDKARSARKLNREIRKASKNESIQAGTRAIASKFLDIDSRLVDDIDEYLAYATALKEAMASAKATKSDGDIEVSLKKAIDYDKFQEYMDKKIEEQEEFKKQQLMDIHSDLVDTGIIDANMSLADMKAIIDNIVEGDNSTLPSEEKERMIRAYLDQAMSSYSSVIEYILENGIDPFTMEIIYVSDADASIVRQFTNMDIKKLPLRDAYGVVEAMENFVVNQNLDGMRATLAAYNGAVKAERIAKRGTKGRPIRSLGISKFGRAWAEQIQQLQLTFEQVFGGVRAGLEIMRESGLLDISRGKTTAKTKLNQIVKEYADQFTQKDFNTAENIFERAMIALLKRNINGTDIQQSIEFNRKKDVILESIEAMEAGSDKEKRDGAIAREVYNKIVKDSNNISDVESSASTMNVDAVNFWIGKFSGTFDELQGLSRTVYNTILERDLNYTPDVFKRYKGTEEAIDITGSSFAATGDYYDTKKSGTLMKNNRVKKLGSDPSRILSFDFDSNMSNAMLSGLTDIETAYSIRQAKAFFESDGFKQMVPDKDTRQLLVSKVKSFITKTKRNGYYPSSELNSAIRSSRVAAQIAVGRALGSIAQIPKQTISVAINTMINTGGSISLLDAISAKDFIDNSGYDIALRGIASNADIQTINKILEREAESPREKLSKALSKASNFWLENFIAKPDVYIARASWIAYYKKDLKKQGQDVSNIDWSTHELNKRAAEYAQAQVNRQQNYSDSDLAGDLLSTSDPGKSFIRKVVFPYMTFVFNQKSRQFADTATLFNKAASKEDKNIAARSLVSLGAEIASYAMVGYGIKELYNAIVNAMIGQDDDDEEAKKRKKSFLQYASKNAATDLLSPIPRFTDGIIVGGVNKILELSGVKENFELPEDKGGSLLELLGVTYVLKEDTEKMGRMIEAAVTGNGVGDYYGKTYEKKLSKEDQEIMKIVAPMYMMYYVGAAPADFGRMAEQSYRKILKRSEGSGRSSKKGSSNTIKTSIDTKIK